MLRQLFGAMAGGAWCVSSLQNRSHPVLTSTISLFAEMPESESSAARKFAGSRQRDGGSICAYPRKLARESHASRPAVVSHGIDAINQRVARLRQRLAVQMSADIDSSPNAPRRNDTIGGGYHMTRRASDRRDNYISRVNSTFDVYRVSGEDSIQERMHYRARLYCNKLL